MLKKLLLNPQAPFWLIAFTALTGLTLPTLIQEGMFMDAMLYTSVSHNLSMGIGTFWFPQFSVHNVAGLSSFHEQPPLVFGIQALFFKVFGDSMYVERFYTFLTMCISAVLINLLWKEIFRNENGLKKLGWLPILLWITIPVCFWSYSNNMHENTMAIFTLSAVLLVYKALRAEKFQVILCILAGVFVFLATMSKGFPGFFPVVVPFLYWMITKGNTFSRTLLQTFIITLVPVIIYAVLFIIPESRESLSTYLFERALQRINKVPTVDSRFYILLRLFMELLPQIALVLIVFLVANVKKVELHFSKQVREAVFFIAVGLAASAPLMLTLVQKGFYFVPSLSFFGIGLSILIAPIILNITESLQKKKQKVLLLLSLFLFTSANTFALMQRGKYSRNKEMIHDVHLIGTVVPRQATVSVPHRLWGDWDLQCYLVRYFNISIEATDKNNFFILDKTVREDIPLNYKKVNLQTLQYDLYKRE